MDAIGVGLIGAGYMGKCRALAWTGVRPGFGDTPIVRRVALCEADEGLARRRAEEFGFETSTADWPGAYCRSCGRSGFDHDAQRPARAHRDRSSRIGQACLVREADGAQFLGCRTHGDGGSHERECRHTRL